MQICTSPQTDNHASTHQSVFTGQMPFLPPNEQCQSTERRYVNVTQVKFWTVVAPVHAFNYCWFSGWPLQFFNAYNLNMKRTVLILCWQQTILIMLLRIVSLLIDHGIVCNDELPQNNFVCMVTLYFSYISKNFLNFELRKSGLFLPIMYRNHVPLPSLQSWYNAFGRQYCICDCFYSILMQ